MSRLDRLRVAHAQAQAAEIGADALSIEGRRHAVRADILARRIRELHAAMQGVQA